MEQAIPCSSRSFVAVPFVDDADGNEKDYKDGERGGSGGGGEAKECPILSTQTHNNILQAIHKV